MKPDFLWKPLHGFEAAITAALQCVDDTGRFLSVQVGDGTTSVTLLAAEFLKQVKPYVEEGLHPQIIIRAFRTATQLVRQHCL